MRAAVLDDLPETAATHFRLYFYAAIIELVREAAIRAGSMENLLERHGFLAPYLNELAERGLEGGTLEQAPGWWRQAVERWERTVAERLPLRELAGDAALDYESRILLVGAGLAEEDGRLASLFDGAAPATGRPGAGLLTGWCTHLEAGAVRARVRRLRECGLFHIPNADACFPNWQVEVPSVLWEAVRGEQIRLNLPWARFRGRDQIKPLSSLCLPERARAEAERIAVLLGAGELEGVIVRGPHHNGRRALLAALAHEGGKGLLEVRGNRREHAPDYTLVGPLAVLLDANPAFVLDPAPGEMVALPELTCGGAFGVVLGPRGGLVGMEGRSTAVIELGMPELSTRRRLWAQAARSADEEELEALSESFRMTSGNIWNAAAQAGSHARVHGREKATIADVRTAARGLDRAALDMLATRIAAHGDWSELVLDPETRRELWTLEARCKHRERLPRLIADAADAQFNCGVRALLRGPSGTGKTLAARVLAATLGKDLYRVDLSSVVNKYIGETEKNLERALGCAEELDVILLFDEGDALFGRRTGVQSSNDRYANLETSFLLQRIEAYEGILLITTNLAAQIDSAFQRRIDVVVDFPLPGAQERLAILRLHLPAGHRVRGSLLEEIAHRCALSGGQIRNAVLHASLVALAEKCTPEDRHLEGAVQREYRKTGAVSPLRSGKRTAVAAA